MAIAAVCTDDAPPTAPVPLFDRVFEMCGLLAVVYLLAVGLWSGPAFGATLVYPNGLLAVEGLLALTLVVRAVRGRLTPVTAYPFFWPCIVAVLISALAAVLRVTLLHTDPAVDFLRAWRQGEPMLRGWLLFLAIVGNPRALRLAWWSALAGMALLAGAAIAQHIMHVSRWYPDLDGGWAGGWMPTRGDNLSPSLPPRVQSLTSYINLSAAMLAASLPWWGVPAALRVPAQRRWRVLLLCGGLATAAALWYTNSRGPMLAVALGALPFMFLFSWAWRASLLVALAAFVLAVLPAQPGFALGSCVLAALLSLLLRRRHLRYALPIVIALALAGGIQTLDAFALHYQLTWRVSETGMQDNARILIYRDAVHTIAQAPWLGVGNAEVARRVLGLSPGLSILPRTQQNYHNQYLHWAAAEGVPVALAFIFLVGYAVYWCWRMSPRVADPLARAIGLATAFGLTIFLIANLVDAHFWRIEGGAFFWSLLAVAAAGVTHAGGGTNANI